jgi:hypothetical protein
VVWTLTRTLADRLRSCRPALGVAKYCRFQIPLASAMARAEMAEADLGAGQTERALAEAREAIGLAPTLVKARAVAGDALPALSRKEEAVAEYEAGLNSTLTIEHLPSGCNGSSRCEPSLRHSLPSRACDDVHRRGNVVLRGEAAAAVIALLAGLRGSSEPG